MVEKVLIICCAATLLAVSYKYLWGEPDRSLIKAFLEELQHTSRPYPLNEKAFLELQHTSRAYPLNDSL